MDNDHWHDDFNPRKFLERVSLEKLLERNEAYNGSATESATSPCILCTQRTGKGILLSDRSFLCTSCFGEVALVSYPERYEALRRQYVLAKESWTLAKRAFFERFEHRLEQSSLIFFGWASLILLLVNPVFVVGSALLLVIGYMRSSEDERRLLEWKARRDEWFAANPEPKAPELRHFHDPAALLSARDRAVLRVFNHWPGYPPFWKYLRSVVLASDGVRCQVSGCPSRLELHVHHKRSVADGGSHAPNNLVSLCDFHHALEPEKGHERIWADIKTHYFTLVRGHQRSNGASDGAHNVRPHLRRLQLVSLEELSALRDFYGLSCPECLSPDLAISVDKSRCTIHVACRGCDRATEGPRQLTEESGPLLAEILRVSQNKGRWQARWDMLAERRAGTWGEWRGRAVAAKRRKHKARVEAAKAAPKCPKCRAAMKVVRPRPVDSWKPFWGCVMFRATGCKGSSPFISRDI